MVTAAFLPSPAAETNDWCRFSFIANKRKQGNKKIAIVPLKLEFTKDRMQDQLLSRPRGSISDIKMQPPSPRSLLPWNQNLAPNHAQLFLRASQNLPSKGCMVATGGLMER